MKEHIEQMLRTQAWERAKGELQSMLHTFYDSGGRFEKLNEVIANFIAEVEDNALHE